MTHCHMHPAFAGRSQACGTEFRYYPASAMECSVLKSVRKNWLVIFASIALFFAQSAALLHQLSHAAGGPDGPPPPGQHSGICVDCVSHAPLLAMAGGAAVVLFLALQIPGAMRPCSFSTPAVRAVRRAYRSRAPPR